MSYNIAGQTSGIFSSDASCNTLDVSNVINNSLKSSLFFNNFNSSNGYVLVGQNVKQAVGISYLSLTTTANYIGTYCEFILSGTHTSNGGFSIKYEFCITNNPSTNVIYQGGTQIASAGTITGTTIGTEVESPLPTIVQTTSSRVTTFNVNCATNTGVEYVLFYRIMGRQLSVQNL
jgi:hypothetical protein